jgi:hypothetical protein
VTADKLVKPCARANRSTFRSAAIHPLEDPGKNLLEPIEVQTRSYFGEALSSALRTTISANRRFAQAGVRESSKMV